jgi:hypothetical protein
MPRSNHTALGCLLAIVSSLCVPTMAAQVKNENPNYAATREFGVSNGMRYGDTRRRQQPSSRYGGLYLVYLSRHICQLKGPSISQSRRSAGCDCPPVVRAASRKPRLCGATGEGRGHISRAPRRPTQQHGRTAEENSRQINRQTLLLYQCT